MNNFIKVFAKSVILILLVCLNLNINGQIYSDNYKQICTKEDNTTWINIFIHGTVGTQSALTFKTFFLLLKDAALGTQYEKDVLCIRQNPKLNKIQPIQELGLQPIDLNCSNYTHDLNNNFNLSSNSGKAAYIFASIFDKIDHLTSPADHKNLYYTFGWSGILSYTRRYEDSRELYCSLRDLIKKLNSENIFPKIRIIGYSHGGSLGLNLGALRQFEFPQDSFLINELILLGTPIQESSKSLIWMPIFEKIYNIYSSGDHVQRIDIFNTRNILSQKRFSGNLPQNLTQIELNLIGKPFRHCKCSSTKHIFFKTREMNQSPGHIELWFFGWISSNYRKNFCLYPLPAGVFVPYLTNVSQTYFANSKHISVSLYPDRGVSIIKPYHRCNKSNTLEIPFFDCSTISKFRNQAIECSTKENIYTSPMDL